MTPYAKEDGVQSENKRSFLTLVAMQCSIPGLSTGETLERQEKAGIENYQRDRFLGYATQELTPLDALCTRPLQAGSLWQYTHPYLRNGKPQLAIFLGGRTCIQVGITLIRASHREIRFRHKVKTAVVEPARQAFSKSKAILQYTTGNIHKAVFKRSTWRS